MRISDWSSDVCSSDLDVLYTGITLSPAQAEIAAARVAAVDLGDRSRIALCDYRDAQGPYDAIASVEMVEAVGQAYWPAYLDAIARLLRPGGRAAIQYILIDDALFDAYRSEEHTSELQSLMRSSS